MIGIEPGAAGLLLARDGQPESPAAPAPGDRIASEARAADEERAAWVAVGVDQDAAAMGSMLRELRSAGYRVQGFADRTAVIVGAHRLAGAQIALDMARSHALLAVVFNDGAAVELQRTVKIPGGEQKLIDAWLAIAARTLVQQTRFDPLHDLRCEQALRAALPALAAEAQRNGQAEYRVQSAGRELPLTLTRDQLAAAAAPLLEPMATALQALVAGLPECGLLVDEHFASLPGVAALIDAAHVAQARAVPAGSAACAASLLPAAAPLQSGGVQYLTRVPLPAEARLQSLPLLGGAGDDGRPMATHLVYRGRAIPIATGLVIGRDPGEGPAVLALPEGVAGLSRRHCTLRRERGRSQVVDHSQYGSFIDGARVRGRAFLVAGSTLRLGTPGIELPLVSLHEPPAAGGATSPR